MTPADRVRRTPRRRRQVVFLDASVLVAAAGSPNGGSAVALEICGGQHFRAAVSELVLLEARRAIITRLPEAALVRYYQALADANPRMVKVPRPEARFASLVAEKDSHVLAAALGCQAAYLLSLDRKHLLTPELREATLPLRLMTPGEFIAAVLEGG